MEKPSEKPSGEKGPEDDKEPQTRGEGPRSRRDSGPPAVAGRAPVAAAAPAAQPSPAPAAQTSPPARTLLSLDVSDVSAATVADQVRAAYAHDRGQKSAADLSAEDQAEANRWATTLLTMVRHHRAGAPARLEVTENADGVKQAQIVSGPPGKAEHASGALVLSGKVAVPDAPKREPRPPKGKAAKPGTLARALPAFLRPAQPQQPGRPVPAILGKPAPRR